MGKSLLGARQLRRGRQEPVRRQRERHRQPHVVGQRQPHARHRHAGFTHPVGTGHAHRHIQPLAAEVQRGRLRHNRRQRPPPQLPRPTAQPLADVRPRGTCRPQLAAGQQPPPSRRTLAHAPPVPPADHTAVVLLRRPSYGQRHHIRALAHQRRVVRGHRLHRGRDAVRTTAVGRLRHKPHHNGRQRAHILHARPALRHEVADVAHGITETLVHAHVAEHTPHSEQFPRAAHRLLGSHHRRNKAIAVAPTGRGRVLPAIAPPHAVARSLLQTLVAHTAVPPLDGVPALHHHLDARRGRRPWQGLRHRGRRHIQPWCHNHVAGLHAVMEPTAVQGHIPHVV